MFHAVPMELHQRARTKLVDAFAAKDIKSGRRYAQSPQLLNIGFSSVPLFLFFVDLLLRLLHLMVPFIVVRCRPFERRRRSEPV